MNSLHCLHKILSQIRFTTYEKLLSIALLVSADGKRECSPSIKELADYCSCSDRQVVRALKNLENMGYISREAQFIEVEHNARTTNKYVLHFGSK
ncbi:MAG: helix-turn-helix domain-containing protein [Synergistaceae bacterium]|jgi:DNA-binding MarR family transcriptional regulator|nr:helix-turn-helix domain-containing protein [Synergistaceae bacterium]